LVATGPASLSSSGTFSTLASGLSTGVNSFVWTLTNGVCPSSTSTVVINRDDFPSPSLAGSSATVCVSGYTLSGNIPSTGTGSWTVLSGPSSVVTPTAPGSEVTSLGVGDNIFLWSISNGVCPPNSSTVGVQRDALPSPASAGPDQQVCTFTTQLAGSVPVIGSGQWSVLSGTVSLSQPLDPNSALTGIGTGDSYLTWVVSNGVCPPSADTMHILRDEFPGPALAGPDQTLCAAQATLAASPPAIGTGLWSTSGTAQISSPTFAQSQVNQLMPGQHLFVWTISNGVCPTVRDSMTLTVDSPAFPVNAGPDQLLCSSQTTLGAWPLSLGTGNWSFLSGQGLIGDPSEPSAIVSALQTGTNVLIWRGSNGSCADVTDTVLITIEEPLPLPVISSPSAICGASLHLSATTAEGAVSKWQIVTGSGSFSPDNSPQTTVTSLGQGTAVFVYSVARGTCPPSLDTAQVQVWLVPGPAHAGDDATTCLSFSHLSALTPTAGTGTWAVISGPSLLEQPLQANCRATHLGKGENLFRFTVENGICPAVSDDVQILRDSVILIADAGTDFETESPEVILQATNPAKGEGRWELVSGAGVFENPGSNAGRVNGLASGNNVFRWVVNLEGCGQAADEVVIHYREFLVPNAITPNGDGKNDRFHITSLQAYSDVKLTVFNRWGGMVYEDPDYRNDWYGSNLSGQPLADDTYFYSLEIPGKGRITGFVTIKSR
jgi:gliding motility-associated-like protein